MYRRYIAGGRFTSPLSFTIDVKQSSFSKGNKVNVRFSKLWHWRYFYLLNLSYLAAMQPLHFSWVSLQSFSVFCANLSAVVKAHDSKKTIKRSNFPIWLSWDLKRLVIMKKILHKLYKALLSFYDLERFWKSRRDFKELARVCFADYVSRVEGSIPLNIKLFWSHVNILKSAPSIPAFAWYTTQRIPMNHMASYDVFPGG